jgi:hypothetical protein
MPSLDMTAIEEDIPEEKFDFDSPEDVLIYVIEDQISNLNSEWKGWSIDGCTIIGTKENISGAASYEKAYGSFLDYTIADMIDCPKREGYFVVRGITGYYSRGDGYSTDDNMYFYFQYVQPATQKEIDLY